MGESSYEVFCTSNVKPSEIAKLQTGQGNMKKSFASDFLY